MEPRRSLPGSASLESTARRNLEPFLPPSHSVRYTDKPLPPLPLTWGSFASSLSVEASDASSGAPRPRPRRGRGRGPDRDDAPFSVDWDMEKRNPSSVRSHATSQASGGSKRTRRRLSPKTVPRNQAAPSKATQHEGWALVRWDQRRGPAASNFAKPRDRHTLPEIGVPNPIPDVPPDEILSPQPKQSVQKILRLTGNMSPTTVLSSDSPTLHNSSQKIKQLTGLDCGSRRSSWTEDPAPWVDDEVSNVSTADTTSMYSDASSEGDASSIGHAESTFSSSNLGDVDDVYTRLTAPKHSAPAAVLFRDSRSYSEPLVRDALRLSGFTAADSLARPLTPHDERRAPWCREHDGDEDFPGASSPSSSSSDEHSDVTELEHTAGRLYHLPAFPLVGSSTESSLNSRGSAPSVAGRSAVLGENFTSPSPPPRPPRRDLWGPNPPDDMAFAGHKGNTVTSDPGSANDEGVDRSGSGSLSGWRLTTSGRGPSPPSLSVTLTTATPSPSPPPPPPPPPPVVAAAAGRKGGGGHRARTRTSADNLDAHVDETEAISTRSSLLAKIFTSGTTTSGSSSSNNNNNNDNNEDDDDDGKQPPSTWSPDTPEAKITTFAAAAASLVRRAADSASTTTTAAASTVVTTISGGGGSRSSSLMPLDGGGGGGNDGGEASARGVWKRTLDQAKSKAGMRNSSSGGGGTGVGGSSSGSSGNSNSGGKADKRRGK